MCKFKKRVPGLCISWGPKRKHRTDQLHEPRRTNHDVEQTLMNLFIVLIRYYQVRTYDTYVGKRVRRTKERLLT